MRFRFSFAPLIFCVLALCVTVCFPLFPVCAEVRVDAALQEAVEKDESTGYIVHFKSKPTLVSAYSMDWKTRGRFVASALKAAAETSQAGVKTFLAGRGARYKSFWAGNMIIVERSDLVTFNGLKDFPEIDRIGPRPNIILYTPVQKTTGISRPEDVQTNLTHIKVDQAWELGVKGSGIVVANIDTGVRYTHETLVNQYRGNSSGVYDHNHNWWDPYGDHPTAPADDNGHGTHTMGIMVGDNGGAYQIGMAPEAKWMACRGCNASTCLDGALAECAQWVLAPTDLNGENADPDMRPHVVNNSWGDCSVSYDDWFQDIIDAWHAAGIYPAFANGNAGNCSYSQPPGCNTVGNPARYGNVTGVGATGNSDSTLAIFSNWGPTDDPDTVNPEGYPYLKPQVVAPGSSILSSYADSDATYASLSGTSMATPHVAGLVALIYSACPSLLRDYAGPETIMQNTAVAIPYASLCGGEAEDNVPNNATGWGEIDALAAVQMALAECGLNGKVTGTVVHAKTRSAIEGATVTLGVNATVTDSSGRYTFPYVVGGEYTIVASSPGYHEESNSVAVLNGATTTVNFRLKPKRTARLRGRVTDGSGAKWPLYATVSATSSDGTVVTVTNPRTGVYSMRLYADSEYVVSVSSSGYEVAEVSLTTTGKFSPRNFSLTVDSECTAPGYALSESNCSAQKGGLVTGLVRDANTKGVLGDMVIRSIYGTTSTDSNGRYIIFSPAGKNPLVANPSALGNYGPLSKWTKATAGKIITSDFNLPAAIFNGPDSVSVALAQGSTATQTFTLRNTGGFPASFVFLEYPVTSDGSGTGVQKRISLPRSNYTASADAEGADSGLAPATVKKSALSSSTGAVISELVGYPAYGVEFSAVRGKQFGTFRSDKPGDWTYIGRVDYTPTAGDFLNNDFSKFYAINYSDGTLVAIDTATGGATAIGTLTPYSSERFSGLTGSADGVLYGVSISGWGTRSTLYTIDPATATATQIEKISNAGAIIDIAINALGEMYGVDIMNDMLVKINPATAEGTVVGSIGFDASYAQGMSFEKLTGVLYLAAYNMDADDGERGQLRVVDTVTGNTSLVGTFADGSEVDCLSFATPTDVAWLSTSPAGGTLAARKTVTVKATFDATGLSAGTYKAQIRVMGGTPYDTLVIPVTMTVTPGSSGRQARTTGK